MTASDGRPPLRITGLLPQPNDGSLGTRDWRDASIRIRCTSIAEPLARLGAIVRLIDSRNAARRLADGSLFDADVFVVYQTLEDHREIVRTLVEAGKCVIVDVCDDVALYRGVLGYTWENARLAAGITVPTRSLAERLAARIDTPIQVVADAIEGEPRPLRPPRPDGPLRLFWYGWQHKIETLARRLADLADYATRRPLELTIMTNMDPIRPALARILESGSERLAIRAVPWRLSDFREEMEAADIAIIPYDESVSYSGRSPVRLIQAVWQGRLAISEDLEGYPEFARFGLLHGSIVDGIAWASARPDEAAQGLAEARDHVARFHHPRPLASTWLRVLTGFHERFLAGPVSGAGR